MPTATCMAIEHKDIISLHHIATLPDFRGKGLGKSVTIAPLIEAKDHAKIAILGASAMGKQIYEKLGFKSYGILHRYVYSFTSK